MCSKRDWCEWGRVSKKNGLPSYRNYWKVCRVRSDRRTWPCVTAVMVDLRESREWVKKSEPVSQKANRSVSMMAQGRATDALQAEFAGDGILTKWLEQRHGRRWQGGGGVGGEGIAEHWSARKKQVNLSLKSVKIPQMAFSYSAIIYSFPTVFLVISLSLLCLLLKEVG